MSLIRRLKNLWELSAYRVNQSPELLDGRFKTLAKDIPTVAKKPATIIKPVPNFFETPEDEIRES